MRILTICILISIYITVYASNSSPFEAELLTLSDDTGKVLLCIPILHGQRIVFDFVNSIYASPVRETLIFHKTEGLFLAAVESPSYGVFEYYGLIPDKTNRATLMRKIDSIKIRSSDYEYHRLSIGEISLSLKTLVSDGEPLIITINHECSSIKSIE